MSTRIHHLNCGTLCPYCERLLRGHGSWTKPGRMVCHCLLVETPEALVLVDTGLGTDDVRDPERRLGGGFTAMARPRLSFDETAVAQIRALGYDPRDVRHIVPTHLDLDHVGGLSDFPHARVHVYKPELQQILQPGLRERIRFRQVRFAHQPQWVVHEEQGERWFGFDCIRALPGLATDILLVPLVGHTRGHTGVAVRQGDRWLLHCGDAYYHHSQVTATPRVPAAIQAFEVLAQTLPAPRAQNLERLRQLAISHGDEVELFCAHDPVELERHASTLGI